MQGKSGDQQPQQWSVHAQFTISHPGIDDPNTTPQTRTERDENGVRMFYTWTTQSNPTTTQESQVSTGAPLPTPTSVTESNKQPLPSAYCFQRGNLLFTSEPPRRSFNVHSNQTKSLNVGTNLQDSGYNSELLSPSSFGNVGFPRRTAQPYNRKCRSTCSIILSTTINEQPELEDESISIPQQSSCGRTQSLRCQTPAAHSERPSNFYGCGDPWCYHSRLTDAGPFSPAQESETSCSTGQTVLKRPSFTYTDISKTTSPGVENRCRDAAVQTFEMVDKCTSPFHFKNNESPSSTSKRERPLKKRPSHNSRNKIEPIFTRSHSPSSFTPDSLENQQPIKRLERTPVKLHDQSPLLSDKISSPGESRSSDPTKKPRTVHIDVYCTGTEQESEGSSSEIESKTASSPQTVFESEKVKITHSRSDEKDIPLKLKEQLPSSTSRSHDEEPVMQKIELRPGYESDNDDNASTAYPSQISSYSTIPGLSSFSSSVPPSWSTYSMSVDNDYDSVANTSWKDTFSDFDSLNRSHSSIAPTDSLDFVPRKLPSSLKSSSLGDRTEEDRTHIATPSITSLNPSDSFEYAHSEDRLRIKRMEQMWKKSPDQNNWKSPKVERKHLLQQQKLKEYVEKRFSTISLPKTESKDSDSDSDNSEKGWSFVKEGDKKLQRDVTVRKASKDGEDQILLKPSSAEEKYKKSDVYTTGRSPTLRSPSVMAIQERLTLNPTLRSPFMVVPGIFTDQRHIAKKFGSVVDVFKKPGHHIGPSKNPECQCDHCIRYFENNGRGRTRSVGAVPSDLPWLNWRRASRYSQPRESRDVCEIIK